MRIKHALAAACAAIFVLSLPSASQAASPDPRTRVWSECHGDNCGFWIFDGDNGTGVWGTYWETLYIASFTDDNVAIEVKTHAGMANVFPTRFAGTRKGNRISGEMYFEYPGRQVGTAPWTVEINDLTPEKAWYSTRWALRNGQTLDAVKFMAIGASDRDPRAENELGYAYIKGIFVPKDPVRARQLFKDAAERGNTDAQVNYALTLKGGIGGPADPDASAKWIARSGTVGADRPRESYGLMSAADTIPWRTNDGLTPASLTALIREQEPPVPLRPSVGMRPLAGDDRPAEQPDTEPGKPAR